MARNGSVRRLVFVISVGAYEYRRHHCERAERRGNHVAHDVAVVVLYRPDIAALAPYYPCYGVVYERVKILYSELFKFGLVVALVNLGEYVLEGVVVLFAYGVLGGEPEVLLCVYGVLEAGVSKRAYGRILVVLSLYNAGALEVVYRLTERSSVFAGKYKLRLALFGYAVLRRLVYVSVSVTCDGYRLFPVLYDGLYAVDDYRRAEYRAVKNGAYRAVRALPHLFEVVLLYALSVRGYGGALYRNAVFLCGVGGVISDLIVRLVPFGQTEVVILCLEVDEGREKLVLYHLPYYSCHFVAVHLDERRLHLNFAHCPVLFM